MVVAAGEIDLCTSPELREALTAAAQRSRRVIVDVTRVTFLDSTGMAAIVATAKHAHPRQERNVCLVGATGPVLRVLEITGLTAMLPIYSSVEEAGGARAWGG